jgi:L-malate glycosyltransferase
MHMLYDRSFAYIYTAPEEDFGMGVIEAMSHCKPVLAWNKAGPSRIINPGVDGFLLNLKDTSLCAEQIYELLVNQNLYATISLNAKETIRNNYLWDHHQQILLQSIEEIQTLQHAKYTQNISIATAIVD